MTNYIDRLVSRGACRPAIAWLREAGHPTLAAAWRACRRGDWLLWLAAKANLSRDDPWGTPEHRVLCSVVARIARVQQAAPIRNDRTKSACEAAVVLVERYSAGEAISRSELRYAASAASAAYAAAYAAAYDAYAAYAAAAAYDAAAYAADAYAADAAAAAYDAYDAADAADAADGDYMPVRDKALAASADLVREVWPEPPAWVAAWVGEEVLA